MAGPEIFGQACDSPPGLAGRGRTPWAPCQDARVACVETKWKLWNRALEGWKSGNSGNEPDPCSKPAGFGRKLGFRVSIQVVVTPFRFQEVLFVAPCGLVLVAGPWQLPVSHDNILTGLGVCTQHSTVYGGDDIIPR